MCQVRVSSSCPAVVAHGPDHPPSFDFAVRVTQNKPSRAAVCPPRLGRDGEPPRDPRRTVTGSILSKDHSGIRAMRFIMDHPYLQRSALIGSAEFRRHALPATFVRSIRASMNLVSVVIRMS